MYVCQTNHWKLSSNVNYCHTSKITKLNFSIVPKQSDLFTISVKYHHSIKDETCVIKGKKVSLTSFFLKRITIRHLI